MPNSDDSQYIVIVVMYTVCMYTAEPLYCGGTDQSVLITEVSLFQG